MKHIINSLKCLSVIALLALAVGCAAEQRNTQNLAIAAGFKAITPATADQQSILKSLPAGQVTPINYRGHSLFVLPDANNNVAYVGRAEEFQAYQQLRLAQQMSNQNLQAAQMNRMAANSVRWDTWGGWGAPGWGGRGGRGRWGW